MIVCQLFDDLLFANVIINVINVIIINVIIMLLLNKRHAEYFAGFHIVHIVHIQIHIVSRTATVPSFKSLRSSVFVVHSHTQTRCHPYHIPTHIHTSPFRTHHSIGATVLRSRCR